MLAATTRQTCSKIVFAPSFATDPPWTSDCYRASLQPSGPRCKVGVGRKVRARCPVLWHSVGEYLPPRPDRPAAGVCTFTTELPWCVHLCNGAVMDLRLILTDIEQACSHLLHGARHEGGSRCVLGLSGALALGWIVLAATTRQTCSRCLHLCNRAAMDLRLMLSKLAVAPLRGREPH